MNKHIDVRLIAKLEMISYAVAKSQYGISPAADLLAYKISDSMMDMGLAELFESAKDALDATVDEGVYPDGPCISKEIRDALRAAIVKITGP